VSRVLNVTKVDPSDAVKIALELKKKLIDQGSLNTTQTEMENQLFQILQSYGYGNEYISRYRITAKFHHQRVPLIILITGTRCLGKSWLATQLAERLNLSTVLQTNLVHDLMYTIMRDLSPAVSSPYPPPSDVSLFYRDLDAPTLLEEYKKECHMIRQGVDTDIEKCFEEGKAIIIEGHNLDPSDFIELLEQRSSHAASKEVSVPPAAENNTGEKSKDPEEKKKKKNASAKGIVVPFVLSMNARDHKLLIENWLSCSERDQGFVKNLGVDAEAQTNSLVQRLQLVQNYLCTYAPPFVRVDVNAHAFMETLDILHSEVLERIQAWYADDDVSSTYV